MSPPKVWRFNTTSAACEVVWNKGAEKAAPPRLRFTARDDGSYNGHMAILKIARMGHPILARRAEEVPDPTAPQIRHFVEDMRETMLDAPGTGLAAPQVHVSLRIVIFVVGAARAVREDGPEGEAVPFTVLINPEIQAMSPATALGWEGCLSVPGLVGEVPRRTHIRYRAWDLEGREFEREARGFHARVVQHECDHLEGVLYPRRMTDLSRLMFTTELHHLAVTEPEE